MMEKSLMGWAIDDATVFNCEGGSNGGCLAFPCRDQGRHHHPRVPDAAPHKKEGRSKNGPKSREETPKEGMQHTNACCSAINI